MSGKDIASAVGIATLIGMLLSAGIWLGSLQGRVTALEQKDRFLHGNYSLPEASK